MRASPACSGRSRGSAIPRGRVPPRRLPTPKTSPGSSTRRRPNRTSRAACAARRPSRSTIPSCSRSRIRTCGPIPWIYIVEPGNLRLKEAEVPILREFLLRGGTLTFDDFHGPIEWANLERELHRVFPDRKIVDLPPDAPDLSLLLPVRLLSADARARLLSAGAHVGEGRLRRAPARDRGR